MPECRVGDGRERAALAARDGVDAEVVGAALAAGTHVVLRVDALAEHELHQGARLRVRQSQALVAVRAVAQPRALRLARGLVDGDAVPGVLVRWQLLEHVDELGHLVGDDVVRKRLLRVVGALAAVLAGASRLGHHAGLAEGRLESFGREEGVLAAGRSGGAARGVRRVDDAGRAEQAEAAEACRERHLQEAGRVGADADDVRPRVDDEEVHPVGGGDCLLRRAASHAVDHAWEAGAESEQRVRCVRVAPTREDAERRLAALVDVVEDVVARELVAAHWDAEDQHVGVQRESGVLGGDLGAQLGGGAGGRHRLVARRHAGRRVGVAALHLLGPLVQAERGRVGRLVERVVAGVRVGPVELALAEVDEEADLLELDREVFEVRADVFR